MAKKSNTYWDKRALQRLSDSEKMSEEYIKRVKRIYEKAYKDVDKEIAKVYKNYSKNTGLDVQKLKELLSKKETDKVWKTLKRQGLDKYIKNNYKSRISRLEQIQAQIYAKAKLIYPKEELEQTMCYKGVINDSYYKALYDTQMGLGYDFSFNKIDKNMMTALLNEKWSGKNYSERIWGNTDILADSLSEVISSGMISGQSMSKMSKQIRDRFNVSKYYAERLVRTEVNHFNNMADAMAYEEMGIDKYVFVAILDDRTSEKCQSMDNKVFDYKDRQDGVNYPPLHPNCRSKTRGYMGEDGEKLLKRKALNPKTGDTEYIENISYKEWAKKNGLVKKTSKKPAKTSKNNAIKQIDKSIINTTDLPIQFTTGKELDNTKLWVNHINNSKGADPKVAKVYGLMGKMQKYPFKISHAKGHSLRYVTAISDCDIKLTIPKIKDSKDIGAINTVLHENMHWVDFMCGDQTYNGQISLKGGLLDVVSKTNADFSDDIAKVFRDFNKEFNDIQDRVNEKYSLLINELRQNKTLPYSQLHKEWDELIKSRNLEINTLRRNANGGGVDDFQDIYDALSGGMYREAGVVKYGHGKKYFGNKNNRVKEIVANYGALSISRPDLIELLRADKPALVNELDKLMDTIIKKYGG